MDSRELRDTNEIDLMDYIRPLIPRWKLLLLAFVIGGVASFAVSSAMPKKYRSTAVVFVQQNSGAASLLKNLPMSMGATGGSSTGYISALLQSDSMRLAIIKKLDLLDNKTIFKKKPTTEEALEKVGKLISVAEGKSGSITITVVAGDPKLAANIANSSVDLLGSFVVTASKKKADFTQKKLQETSRDLDKAESELKDFMERYGVASVDDQTKGMILQLGELDGQVLTMEAELEGVISQQQNAADLDNLAQGEVRRKALEASLEYVRKQRDDLKAKLSQLPSIGARYARIQRRVLVLSKTFEQLTEQYQLARVTQKGEDGDYQIIDRARPNFKHVSPRRTVASAAGAVTAFVFVAFAIVMTGGPKPPTRTTRPITRSADRETKTGPVSRV